MVSANSRTSAAVGPFIFIDTPKAAIWAGVAAPVMIWSIAQAACPWVNSNPVVNRLRTCGHDVSGDGSEGVCVTARSSHRHAGRRPCRGRQRALPKLSCDQFRPWLYLTNYKASYFSL